MRRGTATFTPGANEVELEGTAAQTISAVGGEIFSSLTINNSFATSPQVTLNNAVTVSSILTMLDGNVNLSEFIIVCLFYILFFKKFSYNFYTSESSQCLTMQINIGQ